jgi:SAM-dependent methyltransferase
MGQSVRCDASQRLTLNTGPLQQWTQAFNNYSQSLVLLWHSLTLPELPWRVKDDEFREITAMHNEAQIAFWNGPGGDNWVTHNRLLEEFLHPLGMAARELMDWGEAHRVLDIGCGCGNQTLSLARSLSQHSEILGVDVSEPMLALAREQLKACEPQPDPQISFLNADASHFDFEAGRFDRLYSRFGVMFFEDPVQAFENLRRSASRDAQLGFICWQAPDHNPFMTVPGRAAMRFLPAPEPAPPGAPGPFAFADRDRVAEIIKAAGFSSVDIQPLHCDLNLGAGRAFDTVVQELLDIGPVAAMLREANPELRDPVMSAVSEALAPYFTSQRGLSMPAAFWLVRAVNR